MSDQTSIPAVFMRGGTSKGLFFREEDLPNGRSRRDRFLLAVIGSPDGFGRQLDGMGGGVSSLSKAMIVSPSARPGVDVDYLFAQIPVAGSQIDYSGNCGNLSSAVGVFAVDQGLAPAPDGPAVVRMFNLNTAKRVDCALTVRGGRAVVTGDLSIAGVSGAGSPIRLDMLDPGGAGTGELLPTGNVIDRLTLPGGEVDISIIDAANPCVFVAAHALGLSGIETPEEMRARPGLLTRMEAIRTAAAILAGMASDGASPPAATPKIAITAPPRSSPTLAGAQVAEAACDIQIRMLSMGAPHLAIPLTGAMCAAVAARIPGTIVNHAAHPIAKGAPLRIAHPSGVLPVSADVSRSGRGWRVSSVSVLRTARTLMTGQVWAPAVSL